MVTSGRAALRAVVGLAAVIGLGAGAALVRLPALPVANRPASDARFIPLSADVPLIQTIAPPWDRLRRLRIRIRARPPGNAQLVVRITADRQGEQPQTSCLAIVPIAQADADGYLDVQVEPLSKPVGGRYLIALTARPPDADVAVWANPRESHPGGSLLTGHGADGGDLVFAAFSAAHQPAAFLRAVLSGRPAPLDSVWAIAVAVLLFACAAAWLVVEAWGVPEEPT